MPQRFKVPVSQLTRVCTDDPFDFSSTADLAPLDTVIGQKRAIEAIDFGLNMKGNGYHIFISGPEGTGKTTIIGTSWPAMRQNGRLRRIFAWSTTLTILPAPGCWKCPRVRPFSWPGA